MSNIYIQEPPSNGKVLLKTSLGDIDIELWSKEAPKACRNFVQLCMEGYYNGTIFHRVIKGFIAQGGDPTGTGTGGDSIFGKPFKDEFHQRLKFNRRGLVAMANAGPDDNGSQFFFTLDRADELNKKHTIFAKVTGNTIYNMIRFNDLDIADNDRPHAPPKIIKSEVLSNPFDDLEPRKSKKELEDEEKKKSKGKSKSKATKNYKLLSFGEEAEEDEEETEQFSMEHHIKSSHDVLDDPKLSSEPALDPTAKGEQEDEITQSIRKKLKKDEKAHIQHHSDDEEELKEKHKKDRTKALQVEAKKLKKELKGKDKKEEEHGEKEEEKKEKEPVNDLMRTLAEERKSFLQKKKEDSLLKKGGSRESQTLALLAGFETKLSTIISEEPDDVDEETNDQENNEDDTDEGWMSHKLKFDESSDGRAKDANVKGDDWYDIYDPRNPMNKRKREKSMKESEGKKWQKMNQTT